MLAWNRKHRSDILTLGAALDALFGAAVMRAAERLPIGLVPEQPLVASMCPDVIDHGRRHQSAGALAHDAQRMLAQVRCPRLVPAGVVAALPERAAAPVMLTVSLRSRSRVQRTMGWRTSRHLSLAPDLSSKAR